MNFRKLYTNHIIKRLCSSFQKNQVELLTKELGMELICINNQLIFSITSYINFFPRYYRSVSNMVYK